jgi:hypothetical protein
LHLLAFCFLCQLTLEPFPFAGFKKEGVFLYLLDYALLLNLSLKTPKGALDGFAIEYPNLCQSKPPSNMRSQNSMSAASVTKQDVFPQLLPNLKSAVYPKTAGAFPLLFQIEFRRPIIKGSPDCISENSGGNRF